MQIILYLLSSARFVVHWRIYDFRNWLICVEEVVPEMKTRQQGCGQPLTRGKMITFPKSVLIFLQFFSLFLKFSSISSSFWSSGWAVRPHLGSLWLQGATDCSSISWAIILHWCNHSTNHKNIALTHLLFIDSWHPWYQDLKLFIATSSFQ